MTDTILAHAYARGLFKTAQALGQEARVSEDIRALEAQWQGSPELRIFCTGHLRGNTIHHAEMVRALGGISVSVPLMTLLQGLAKREILRLIPQIIRFYLELLDISHKFLHVEARFAVKPNEAMLMSVHDLVRAKYGREYRIVAKVDPDLIAGFLITINDIRIDASLGGRLKRLRQALHKPAV
jgi:F-type H+-transporting ATPase subunit delta